MIKTKMDQIESSIMFRIIEEVSEVEIDHMPYKEVKVASEEEKDQSVVIEEVKEVVKDQSVVIEEVKEVVKDQSVVIEEVKEVEIDHEAIKEVKGVSEVEGITEVNIESKQTTMN